ncbi:hypothetical protein GCM10009118_07260 [Wandonia haliotis]|uniref:Carbohydrate-binding module family 96 domain-containing protein n=1 Tax=Wandonia haliotis TaxID=574963 RepID=A0ABN1MN13_9FLAO
MFVDQNCLPVRGRYAYVVALVTLLFLIRPVSAQVSVPLTPSDDAYVYSLISNNYGGAGTFSISKSSGPYFTTYTKSLLKFDLSSIPDNAIITSAELKLAVSAGTPIDFLFQQLTEDWSESTVTWNTMPTETTQYEFSEIPTTSTISGPGTINHHFNALGLVNMVQKWVNYSHLNNGFVISRSPSLVNDNNNSYRSKEDGFIYWGNYPNGRYVTIDVRPQLTVQYVLPIEINLVSVTHASGTSSGDGSISATASGGNGTYTYQWYNSSGSAIGTNSPTISGLNYGWYGVKVTDGLGVESYMSFIVGVECEKVSITYNPGADYVDDAYISNLQQTFNASPSPIYYDYIDNNYGNLSNLIISRGHPSVTIFGEIHNSFNLKTLLKFNLLLDPVFKINKSDLKLQVTSIPTVADNIPFLRLTTEQWQEHVVTYNNQPAHSSSVEKSTGITSLGSKIIDTKAFWEYWQGNPNYGYFIDLQYPNSSSSRSVQLRSSEYTTAAQRPQMEFEVSLECGSPVKTFRQLNNSYYETMRDRLFVEYEELNEKGTIQFRIIDASQTNISNGMALVAIVRTHGKSVLEFDFSNSGQCLPTGFYILELTDHNGRLKTLRFKHENTGC